jgi:hypothetical protein
MEKIDVRRQLKEFYSPSSKQFSAIEIPRFQYLKVDGHGDPNKVKEYSDAVQTLYGISYTLKFHLKKTQGIDYTVMGLEGLWWMPDMLEFSLERKDDWDWTMMILQPDFITPEVMEEAKNQAATKGKAPLAGQARLESLDEGTCVQIMYFGPYIDEAPVIAQMHSWIRDNVYSPAGKHHEIYLSDPRRVAPEKNKTILRQPIKKGL